MNATPHNSEKGQAIVYLVIGLVVFLGFVALALDGGMALADRRHSQNGADSSALAGAGEGALYLENHQVLDCNDQSWSCGNDDVYGAETAAVNTAISRAAANNFAIVWGTDYNTVHTTCAKLGVGKDYIDVNVKVSTTITSNFAQLLFPNALTNNVDAVTRIHPRAPLGFGNAIIGLNPQGCSGNNGVTMYGSGNTDVTGGGIFSNGCLRGNGSAGTVTAHDGTITGHYVDPGQLGWSPVPQETTDTLQPSDFNIDPPACPNVVSSFNVTGTWIEHQLSRGDTYLLAPGLWCISGDLTINQNVSNPDQVVIRGEGVTLDMLNGKFTVNGPANVQLYAPSMDPGGNYAPQNSAVPGLLIYLPPTNTNSVILNGNQTAEYAGLVYAPRSYIQMNGTGFNNYINSQVIGWDVLVGGNASTSVNYNPCTSFIQPTKIELSK